MPKLIIKGFNPLQTSERANLFIIPEEDDQMDFLVNKYIAGGEYECVLPAGEYHAHVMSMIYDQLAGIKISMKEKDIVIDLNMEVDLDFRPSKNSDYLITRGWHQDAAGDWVSPKITIKHFDSFLCAKFNEFLDTQAKMAEEDDKLSELHNLKVNKPSDWEKAMWLKYREITHDDYQNFVVDSIIDA